MCTVMQEYEQKAVISMLLGLIKDGILSEDEAAERAGIPVQDFHRMAESLPPA